MSSSPGAGGGGGRIQMVVGAVLAILGFAFTFVLLTSGVIKGTGSITKTRVVAASHDIPVRTQLTADDLTIRTIDVTDMPNQAFTSVPPVVGLITSVPIPQSQLVLSNEVVKSSDTIDTARPDYLPIPSGYVALAIPYGDQQGVGNQVKANDYITVIATMNASGRYSNVETVFTDIRVLKVSPTGSTLDVLVTQCQAEYLQWFSKNAVSVVYTLESYHDYLTLPTKPDAGCATVNAAGGVTATDVSTKWPRLTT